MPQWHNSLLKHLDLSFNELNTLPEDAFVHLPYLEQLLLPGNGLQVLPDRLFVSNTRISFLDVSHNGLTTLGTTTFRRLKHLKVLKASDNKLVQLQPTLFEANFLLSEIFVHNNKLTSLSSQLLNATQISLLSLNDNPWHCDCSLKTFLEEVHSRGASLVAATECATPPAMAKRDVILLFHDQIACNVTAQQGDTSTPVTVIESQ
ncbi:carboxypeptidase N subunit 2-like [Schistocerca cancellata]|uniref:carboxypeptidase N subunit 2-like n=1 Tax=Schistocerca cancellata TaxID=274614 RepID=UPI002117E093|nr:carboxypeptidase N subunit 2-like [Schistocerca cancellata]